MKPKRAAKDLSGRRRLLFPHRPILPLVRTYASAKNLTVKSRRKGFKSATPKSGRGLWEISLFQNPQIAPLRLTLTQRTVAKKESHRTITRRRGEMILVAQYSRVLRAFLAPKG